MNKQVKYMSNGGKCDRGEKSWKWYTRDGVKLP